MVAKPPGGRPGMAGEELTLPESRRPAEPGPSLIASPGRGTPVPGLLAEPACRAATPSAPARLVCFVCCMMSLLFCSYVLFTPGKPAASFSRIGSRLPLSHTFHEHSFDARAPDSLLPSDATHTTIDQFLWCHPRKQNGHTRHLVATKVGAVVFATSEQESSECGRRMGPNAHGCRSSDRAGRCCVHRLGRGRGGRREGA